MFLLLFSGGCSVALSVASALLSLILAEVHHAFKCVAGLSQEWVVVVVVEASGAWIIWATWDMA